MKNKRKLSVFILSIVVFIIVLSCFMVSGAQSSINGDKKYYIENEVIIKFKDDIQAYRMSTEKVGKDLKFKESLTEDLGIYEINNGETVRKTIEDLMENDSIEYAQPNYLYRLLSFPNDEYFDKLWGFHNTENAGIDINIIDAWNITKGKEEIVVAVIDDGINIEHPDLKENIWINKGEIEGNEIDDDGNGYVDDINGWDFANDCNTIYDEKDGDYHGTHVAGIIAASANDIGVIGVAPNIKIMPLKFINGKTGTTTDAVKAIEYAKENGADIVNCSWGEELGEDDMSLKNAIEDSGLLFICAAGNKGMDNDVNPVYPASLDCENIISVAAMDNKGKLASFSNYGSITVDIGAPGSNILSTIPEDIPEEVKDKYVTVVDAVYEDNLYGYISGTSMATPHVTGIAALLKSKNHDLTPLSIKNAIIESIKSIDNLKDRTVSGGMADAYEALKRTAPERPSSLKATKSGTSISLNWDGNETGDFKEYIIERKIGSKSLEKLTTTADKNYTDNGIDKYTKYTYRIKAIDEWGNASVYSKEVAVAAASKPSTGGGSSKPSSGGGGSGGGGGGGSPSGSEGDITPSKAKPEDNFDNEIKKQLDKNIDIIEIKPYSKGNIESFSLTSEILAKILENKKDMLISGNDITFEIPSAMFETEELKKLLSNKNTTLSIKAEKLKAEEAKKLLNQQKDKYLVSTEEIYELTITIKDSNKDRDLEKFNGKIKISIKINENIAKKYGKNRLGIYRYDEEKKLWEYKGGLYNPSTDTITITVDHFSKYAIMFYKKDFEDIKEHWAKEEIEILVSKHIAEGRKDKYEPNESITRIELVKMLVKMLLQDPGKDVKLLETSKVPFKDISITGEDKNYIKTAVEEGIIKGFEDGTFRPEKAVSREEMAVMTARMMGIKTDSDIIDTPFKDKKEISSWAAKDIAAVYEKGIIKGDDKGNFDGKRFVTRGEASVMVKRIMENTGLIDLPTKITGKLVINHIEGTHYELETSDGIYVLILDKNDKTLNNIINDSIGEEITVKGYIQSGYNIYQRGKMFKVVSVE